MINKLINAFGKVFLTIQADNENGWLHTSWHGYLSEANIKEGAIAISDAISETGFNSTLNDMRLVLGPIRSSEWATNEWSPEVAKKGLKFMALVNAPDGMSAPDVVNFHNTQTYFETNIFTSITEAQKWLQQCRSEVV